MKNKVRNICVVSEVGAWKSVGLGEITVDSAAEESVCPKNWGSAASRRRGQKSG